MTSSPFSKLKLFGVNPERSLEQAYEAALKIKSFEDQYFNGNRIPIESAENNAYFPSFLKGDFETNFNTLKQKTREFNGSNFAENLEGSNLDKLIFIEGVLAKYTMGQPASSGLVPTGNADSGNLSTIDVQSDANKRGKGSGKVDTKTFLDKSSVLPRSIGRTIGKIKTELNPLAEQELVSDFRRSRTKTVIALRLLALLIIIPILTQQVAKNFFIVPIVTQARGEEAQVFINSEMREELFEELKVFEEEIKYENLITEAPPISKETMESKVKEKALELAEEFREKSNSAIGNVFADIVAAFAFAIVLFVRRKDIEIFKSFIDNIVYGLSDSAKAFILILFTDIFVGFHSPHGWEVLLEATE